MPNHFTNSELFEIERRRKSKPKQLTIFDEVSIEHPIRERIFESHGHHWLSRSNGRWEEHIQID